MDNAFALWVRTVGLESGWKPGQVYLSSANGRWAILYVMTEGGGVDTLTGYLTTREMADCLSFFTTLTWKLERFK